MPFNSETGRLAGQKSKRGQGALSKEIRIIELSLKNTKNYHCLPIQAFHASKTLMD